MRNNISQPSIGHVIMFAAAAAGWLVLFLVNLAMFTPGAAWWIKAGFSALGMVASGLFGALLLVRVLRQRGTAGNTADKVADQG